jgi:transmembrane sensor
MMTDSLDRPIDSALLDRYLAGEQTSEERAHVERWLAQSEHRRLLVEELTAPGTSDATGHLWLQRVHTAISESEPGVVRDVAGERAAPFDATRTQRNLFLPRPLLRRDKNGRPIFNSIAVAFCAVVMTVIGLSLRSSSPRSAEDSAAEYVTGMGEQRALTLLDGSQIRLAPKTVLRVDAGFGAGSRSISLQGEAYFDVPHATGVPFTVRTKHASIRVLGTRFGVSQHVEQARTRIVVSSGRVAVAPNGSGHSTAVTLTPSSSGLGVTASGVMTQDSVDTAWISGRLVFRNAPLPEVLAALTRWYGFTFRVTDSTLVRETLTLGVSTSSGTTALATLQHVLEAQVTVDGKTVTIRHKPRAGVAPPARRSVPPQLVLPTNEVGR